MKTRWLWTLVAWAALTFACNLPTQKTSWTQIIGVNVTPSAGEKDFSLEVQYSYTWDRETPNAEIYCVYATPSGRTIPIGTIFPEGLDRDRESFSKATILTFSIQPKGGQIEPGVYVAGCSTEHDASPITSVFTVIQGSQPTPTSELPAAPTATLTETPQPAATRMGSIVFDITQTNSSRPSAGGELDLVTQECIPEVTIAPNGVVSGSCDKPHITARLIDESFSAEVTGQVDPQGNISFSYDVSEIGDPNGTWRITYEGQGSFTSANEAAGTATFSYSCNSGADNLIWCWQSTSESFSGTIPWRFVPAP